MSLRNPHELDRDWFEIGHDIDAIIKRVDKLPATVKTNQLHINLKQSIVVHLKLARLNVDMMRAKELQK